MSSSPRPFFCGPGRRKYAVAGVLAAVSLAVTVRLGAPHYTRGGLDALCAGRGAGGERAADLRREICPVDCGSRNSWYDAGGIAADHLATMGCGTLDYLILTHYDYDHISGVAGAAGKSAGGHSAPAGRVRRCRGSGFRWSWPPGTTAWTFNTWEAETVYTLGESSLTIYPPGDVEGDNEQGLAVLCTYGDYDLLITGDRNMAAERQLHRRP